MGGWKKKKLHAAKDLFQRFTQKMNRYKITHSAKLTPREKTVSLIYFHSCCTYAAALLYGGVD